MIADKYKIGIGGVPRTARLVLFFHRSKQGDYLIPKLPDLPLDKDLPLWYNTGKLRER